MPTPATTLPAPAAPPPARAARSDPGAQGRSSCDPRFAQYRATGDRAIRNAIVEDHRWIATHCVRRFLRKGTPADDLLQVALLALVHAVDRFDPALGYRFSTFAVPTVTGELLRHFRDHGWAVRVGRRSQENYLTVKQVAEELEQALGRSPTIPEVAAQASLDVDDTLEALHLGGVYRGVSLDAHQADEGDDGRSAVRALRTFGIEERGYALTEARTVLPGLLASLPSERDRRIVRLRFVDEMSQSRIAAEVGLSQIQVSRILRSSLRHMREQLT